MRAPWIAAGLASLSVGAWSAAIAQEGQPQPDQNAPFVHRPELGKAETAPGPNGPERAAPNFRTDGQAAPRPSRDDRRQDAENQTGKPERGGAAEGGRPAPAGKAADTQARPQEPQTGRDNQKAAQSEGSAGKDRQTEQGATKTPASQQRADQAASPAENRNGQPTNAPARTNEAATGQGSPSGASVPANRANEAATGRNPLDPQQVRATGSAQISHDNAVQIAKVLNATSAEQNANIAVNVGAPPPGDVDVQPLPTPVVELVPEYRGYDYVVANDEIVIVEPTTRKVVEVISEGGAPSPPAEGTTTRAAAGTRGNPCGP